MAGGVEGDVDEEGVSDRIDGEGAKLVAGFGAVEGGEGVAAEDADCAACGGGGNGVVGCDAEPETGPGPAGGGFEAACGGWAGRRRWLTWCAGRARRRGRPQRLRAPPLGGNGVGGGFLEAGGGEGLEVVEIPERGIEAIGGALWEGVEGVLPPAAARHTGAANFLDDDMGAEDVLGEGDHVLAVGEVGEGLPGGEAPGEGDGGESAKGEGEGEEAEEEKELYGACGSGLRGGRGQGDSSCQCHDSRTRRGLGGEIRTFADSGPASVVRMMGGVQGIGNSQGLPGV